MFKRIFLIIIGCWLSFYSYSQCFPIDTAKLNTAYRELRDDSTSQKWQKAFFNAFPATWMEFVLTYQYANAAMSHVAMEHIAMLWNLLPMNGIPDSVYCDKIINLSIGGKWDADAPNFLNAMIHKVVSFRTELMFDRLSKQSRGFQLRFWQFYWSSLLANKTYKTECDELSKKMQLKYPKEVKIMKIAMEFAWQEMDYPFNNYPQKMKIGNNGIPLIK
jgi:hypothetical protein